MKSVSWGTRPLTPVKSGVVFIRTTLSFITLVLCITSCTSTKNVAYFQDIPDSLTSKSIAQAIYKTPTVQVDDILQITVQTLDPGAT
ncbi:MAG TPA: hypothetical protein VGC22_12440, partial [Chitinophaga sp.]